MCAGECSRYSWNHVGEPGSVATTSATVVADVETVISAPAAASPRAVARSPSGCAIPGRAQGATPIGVRTSLPSSGVPRSTMNTPRRTWGRTPRPPGGGASASVVSFAPPA